jgi:mRNA-degrading endonuclease RelE of RelBE toxin-antitoxin system
VHYRVELSSEAERQLSQFPRDAQERIERAIDELEVKDDSQWSNIKALQGDTWKGRLRKKVGPYRIIFVKLPSRKSNRGLCHSDQIEKHLQIVKSRAQRIYFSTATFARKFATPAVYLSSVTVNATASSSQS